MQRRLISVAAGLFLIGCGGSSPVQPTAPNTVNATTNQTFSPSTITVAPNTVVTFNFGSLAHNVFFDPTPGAPADIPGNNANVSFTRTFTTPGTFVFNCHIHPGMRGTVIVSSGTTN